VAEAVRRDLLDAFGRFGGELVAVDLQAVKAISSAGIRPLLQLRTKAKEKGGFVALCGLTDVVRDVFEVTRLTTTSGNAPVVFETAADVPAAVAKLKAI
jgi:anti-anti-sigma factor